MDEKKKDNVVKLFQDAAKPARKPRQPAKPAVHVNGDGNVVGNNNMVIKTERHVTKTIAKPEPGAAHITEAQMSELRTMVEEIVRLEAIAKRDPANFPRVWNALRAKLGKRYSAARMMPIEMFPRAKKVLQTWIAQLLGRSTVQKKDPETVRNNRLGNIHAAMKQLDCEPKIRAYLKKNWDVSSLGDLDATALERVYRYVAGLKRAAVKPG